MTRREFSLSLAGSVVLPGIVSSTVTLHAIAGACLPATLTVTTHSPETMRRSLWELRSYQGAAPTLAGHFDTVFSRAGIRPLLRRVTGPDFLYLIPFENLAARDRAWTLLNTDPEWVRARPRFHSYHFGLYRAS